MRVVGAALLFLLGLAAAVVGFLGMAGAGFLALLINPHGGLYGGSQEEVVQFSLLAVAGGVVGVGGSAVAFLAGAWMVHLAFRRPATGR